MLNSTEFQRVMDKLKRSLKVWDTYQFKKVMNLECSFYETKEKLYSNIPEEGRKPIKKGESWGGDGVNGWFRASFTVSEELEGKKLFLSEDVGGLESLVFLNGKAHGVLARKFISNAHGNHHALPITDNAKAGESYTIDVESYCWHSEIGTQPFYFEEDVHPYDADHPVVFNGLEVKVLDDLVLEYYLSLKLLLQIAEGARDDFKRAEIQNLLYDVYRNITQVPDEVEEAVWRAQMERCLSIMRPALGKKNQGSVPWAGITGHSHLDTAWLWTIPETVRKAARTYSNALTMMRLYPEYRFLQSSAAHSKMMKDHYPDIYEGIKEMVKRGQWEPNGAVWIECDCNITGSEAMARQFIYGQRFTQKEFGYTSDTFWLPDTFGYSAALPQIMKMSRVRYFYTTKMAWNDSNKFPFDTFYWQGIDKSKVLANLNDIHLEPTPESAYLTIYSRKGEEKRISSSRYIAFGLGDGGAGPSYDMLEMARMSQDIEGAPRMKYMSASEYMQTVEKEAHEIPTYAGELYLELHRGTLTSQSRIKKGNRRCEEALHALDAASVENFIRTGRKSDNEELWKRLLLNQFHDILPGTCIKEVNIRAVEELETLEKECWEKTGALIKGRDKCLYNPAPFARTYSTVDEKCENTIAITTVEGTSYYGRMDSPAYSSTPVKFEKMQKADFHWDGNRLDSPFFIAEFDRQGTITYLLDKTSERNLASDKGLDRLYLNEDMPKTWDNWDIDKDLIENLHPVEGESSFKLLEKTDCTISFILEMKLGAKSRIRKITRFYAEERRIDFEVELDWHDKHKVLKAGFDLDINSNEVRNEIQFGSLKRPQTRSNRYEEAKFEYSMHRYSDISEPGFGVAILNDSKYGMDAHDSNLTITLIKSGVHPDERADEGRHTFCYSLLPHEAFSAENVIREAYLFNEKPALLESVVFDSLATSSRKNVIIETVKLAEDEKAVVLRVYEAEGTSSWAEITPGFSYKSVREVNFLEETIKKLDSTRLYFKAFEIKTLLFAI